jgi:citrate synthase
MSGEQIQTRVWQEIPEPDNPFATRQARCHGYDVYGDMLGKVSSVEMLFLLFRGEAPTADQTMLLETLAIALMNPGPRDPAVHAAMCGGVGGSTSSACLMAALAVGAGQYTGAREVFQAMQLWYSCGTDIDQWRAALRAPFDQTTDMWPTMEHAPGFDPHGASTSTVVKQTLEHLAERSGLGKLQWLRQQLPTLESTVGCPFAMSGVAAAAFSDLEFSPEEGEMLYLLLRMPGAAAHALEQRQLGHKAFPFFGLELTGATEDAT